MPKEGHELEFRSADESTVECYISFTGEIVDVEGFTPEDHIIENGTAVRWAVGPGIDRLWYTGRKDVIVVSSEQGQFRVNGKAWSDATAYGARVDPGFFERGEGKPSGGGSSSGDHRPDDEPIERGPNVVVETGTTAGDGPFTYTTGEFVRVIDPDSGDDTNPGTKADPLKTIQEYVERLPMVARHKTHGVTTKGRFNEGAIHFPHTVWKEWDAEKGGFRIGPDCFPNELSRAEREEYVLDARQINTRLVGYSTPNNMAIHDMQLEGAVQNRWGTIGVVGCTLNPKPMGPHNTARAYDAYGGTGFVWDCDITERADYAAILKQQGRLSFRRVSADDVGALEKVVNLSGAARSGVFDEWGNELGNYDDWF